MAGFPIGYPETEEQRTARVALLAARLGCPLDDARELIEAGRAYRMACDAWQAGRQAEYNALLAEYYETESYERELTPAERAEWASLPTS